MEPDVELAPGADDNGLANMLATLVRQNIESNAHKREDFARLHGRIAIVAEDVDVALTLAFERGGKLVVHDGIAGVPDLTIRGPSEAIMALSNIPSTTPLGLPIPERKDREGALAVQTVFGALLGGKLHIHGLPFRLPLFLKFGHIMSVNG
jgi:hypothetical protein